MDLVFKFRSTTDPVVIVPVREVLRLFVNFVCEVFRRCGHVHAGSERIARKVVIFAPARVNDKFSVSILNVS